MILFIIALLLLWVSIFHTQKNTLMNMDEVHGKREVNSLFAGSSGIPQFSSTATLYHHTLPRLLLSLYSTKNSLL